jgi:hypothetical protein
VSDQDLIEFSTRFIITLPYGKFAHGIFRSVALL